MGRCGADPRRGAALVRRPPRRPLRVPPLAKQARAAGRARRRREKRRGGRADGRRCFARAPAPHRCRRRCGPGADRVGKSAQGRAPEEPPRHVCSRPGVGWRKQGEERLPPSAEDTGAGIGATLCDAIGYNGVDVSAALSRDEDGDECFAVLRGDDIVLELKVRLLEFVRDDDAFIVWFTADRRQTSLAYPIWTLWPHDRRAFERLVAGLEEIPDCCCVSVDACSIKSASRCRRMAARANGCVY